MEEKHGSVTISRATNRQPASGDSDPWAGVFNRKEPAMKQPEIEMEALKTHLGATGGQVRKGARYVLNSEASAAEHVRLGIGERKSPEATGEEGEAEGVEDLAAKPWTMQVSPQRYVEQWPDGQHAAHARAVIEREGAKT